jgi:hypothetical protein
MEFFICFSSSFVIIDEKILVLNFFNLVVQTCKKYHCIYPFFWKFSKKMQNLRNYKQLRHLSKFGFNLELIKLFWILTPKVLRLF